MSRHKFLNAQVRRGRVAVALMNMYGSVPLPSEFMLVQLFQLASAICWVTMATTETKVMETIQELILQVMRYLNDTPA